MRTRNHGKYTKMNINSPRAIATCDYSGLMVRHMDLVRQNQYAGTGLVWTGLLVNPKFADKPNPQNLVPYIRLDPVPVKNARPDSQVDNYTTLANTVGIISIDVSGGDNVTLTNTQFSNGSITFTGILTNNIVIFIPNIYNQFYANNITTGGYGLNMQVYNNPVNPIGNPELQITIPQADPITLMGPLVANNTRQLFFTPN